MNIVDQMIVLSVFRQVEDDLHLCVQIENNLTHNLCHLITIYAEDQKEREICLHYFYSQKPSKDINPEFMKGRFNERTNYWWPRVNSDKYGNRISSEDHIIECHKQRLEFIRHLIGKVEQMSISQTV